MSERSEDHPSPSNALRSEILFNGKYFPLNPLCWKIFAHIEVNLLDNGKKQSHTLASCVLMNSAPMSIQLLQFRNDLESLIATGDCKTKNLFGKILIF
jgi:hypothetical protein